MADLSKYWFLQNRKEKGAPVGISECSIRTEFNERNPHALRPSDYDEWTSSGWKKVELPEELWLISLIGNIYLIFVGSTMVLLYQNAF